MFGSAAFPSRPGVASSFEQGDMVSKPSRDPSADIYNFTLSGSHLDSNDSPRTDELKVSAAASAQWCTVWNPRKFPIT